MQEGLKPKKTLLREQIDQLDSLGFKWYTDKKRLKTGLLRFLRANQNLGIVMFSRSHKRVFHTFKMGLSYEVGLQADKKAGHFTDR